MNNKKSDFNAITGLCACVFGLIFTAMSYMLPRASIGNPMDPTYFPAGLGLLMVIFGAFLFVKSDRLHMSDSLRKLKNMSASEKRVIHMIIVTCICGVLYAFFFRRVGFVVSTIFFLLGVLFMTNGKRIVTNLVIAILFSVSIFMLFNHGLGIMLPKIFDLF